MRRDIRASLCESPGDGLPDAACRTCDEGRLALKNVRHGSAALKTWASLLEESRDALTHVGGSENRSTDFECRFDLCADLLSARLKHALLDRAGGDASARSPLAGSRDRDFNAARVFDHLVG